MITPQASTSSNTTSTKVLFINGTNNEHYRMVGSHPIGIYLGNATFPI